MAIPIAFETAGEMCAKTMTDNKWMELWRNIRTSICKSANKGNYSVVVNITHSIDSKTTKLIQSLLGDIGYDTDAYDLDTTGCSIKITWLQRHGKRPAHTISNEPTAKRCKYTNGKENNNQMESELESDSDTIYSEGNEPNSDIDDNDNDDDEEEEECDSDNTISYLDNEINGISSDDDDTDTDVTIMRSENSIVNILTPISDCD